MLSHPSLEESIDKVKSAGCLLYGGGVWVQSMHKHAVESAECSLVG